MTTSVSPKREPSIPPRMRNGIHSKDEEDVKDMEVDVDVKDEGFGKLEEWDRESEGDDTSVKADDVYSKAEPDTPMSATPSTPVASSSKQPKPGPQLIGDLPVATEAAMRTFTELPGNVYQYSTLGRSREAMEGMVCDCQYEHGVDDPSDACGPGSDCINRLTQVECLVDDCRCRSYCQNQRFEKKQYAPIEIVQTEKKGFGLRAGGNLAKDQFIYEYVGDVVSHPSFMKRMRDYAAEGIRHFYFMMLQKDEYIDATKRGGIGRFANHSCNPNCYVAKWTVGQQVRMGIFASRKVLKDEELTFNYNVDRYGHDPQPCYCGEPNCVGFLGGKTQTDLGGMDDLYLDALGIADEVAQLGLKGTKKKKGRKLDEDYIPDLKPLMTKDVPKLVQALRQTSSRKVLLKLLTRIKLTKQHDPLRQLMRLRGFSQMTNILQDYETDEEIIAAALDCMDGWPLLKRNKVESSGIDESVAQWAESDNEKLKALAVKLLEQWSELETSYRIAKRRKEDGSEEDVKVVEADDFFRPVKRPRVHRNNYDELELYFAQINREPREFVVVETWEEIREEKERREKEKLEAEERAKRELLAESQRVIAHKAGVKSIIQEVLAKAEKEKAEAEEARLREIQAAEDLQRKKERALERAKERAARKEQKKAMSAEEKEANKEKRLLKLVGAIVVKCMSHHKKEMSTEQFKKHAKELTQLIADKEKKSSSYRENKLESLSEEKQAKVKKFAKDYIAKVVHKLQKGQKSGHRSRPSQSDKEKPPKSSASAHPGVNTQLPTPATTSTPDSPGDQEQDEGDLSMSVNAVLGDLDLDEELEVDPDDADDVDESPAQSPAQSPTRDPRRHRMQVAPA